MEIWNWIVSLFRTRYKLTVSYNSTYGDADAQSFIVRKFYNKQDKGNLELDSKSIQDKISTYSKL